MVYKILRRITLPNIIQLPNADQRNTEIICHYAGIEGRIELSTDEIARKFNIPETEVETIIQRWALSTRDQLTRNYF